MTTYEAAGVSIAEGERAVDLMKPWVERANRPEVVSVIGGFAGLFDASALRDYRHPLLATSADGVGTKVSFAQRLDKHDTIGFDLVGMLVDDLVVCGAEPLFVTDYIACGKVVPERIAAIVKGIAEACAVAGCALLGGETAEHPGLLKPDEYDVAGATTGVVEAADLLGPQRVRPGDVLLALPSSGLHANGYSLVRHVLASSTLTLQDTMPELGRTLGEELLEPTTIYAKPCLAMIRRIAPANVHAMAHVTGGGLAANLARVLPATVRAIVERDSWQPLPIFALLQDAGHVPIEELEATFNLGIGMVAVVAAGAADEARRVLAADGVDAWICGRIAPSAQAEERVTLVGGYRNW